MSSQKKKKEQTESLEKTEINCSGGGLRLSDGSSSFYIELTIDGHLFEFESHAVFDNDEVMLKKLRTIIDLLPKAVGEAAAKRDVEIIEDFCEKWGIYKVRPEDSTRSMDEEEEIAEPGDIIH